MIGAQVRPFAVPAARFSFVFLGFKFVILCCFLLVTNSHRQNMSEDLTKMTKGQLRIKLDKLGEDTGGTKSILLALARTGGGGWCNPPPLRFFADSKKTAARSVAGFWATLWGKPCAIFGKKNLTGSGQVTEL